MAVHRGDGGFSSGDLLGIFYLFGVKRKQGKCAKKVYRTEKEAKRIAAATSLVYSTQRAYRCNKCKMWHLTTEAK